MRNSPRESFFEYVSKKGVKVIESQKKISVKNKIIDEGIINQLKLISEFHSKAMGYDNYIGHKLQDKRGRIVEQYKIYIKKIRRELEEVKKKSELNSLEKLFLQCGDEYLDKAQKCIDKIYENNYLELIKRSMDRIEVCLGNTYFTNLNKEEQIEVLTIEECCYDLVEMDGVYFFNKIKKKGRSLNYKELIHKFCEFENLNQDSEKFIEALISYPYDFMKCLMRYKKDKYELNEEKYRMKLEKIIIDDNKKLI
ncbi:spore coat protein [Clostridium ganghwense]|uniref:Spore coat protein n=1 Tax=Clostridium ganghwense TaxID=312089 RepID=A0ABT4CP87_9CLOT|nr:spore coat protein [Clostridium ganghwense]MCY6369886.1 spore coat protein [Clostridium ganghwense]